jgi:hypothetical protein
MAGRVTGAEGDRLAPSRLIRNSHDGDLSNNLADIIEVSSQHEEETLARSFGPYLSELQAAGVLTQSGALIGNARGCWGGRAADGTPVVTTWTDPGSDAGGGQRYIWKPRTNHGGLRDLWDCGSIHPGARVRVIQVRARGEAREVADARLLPDYWRVVLPPHVEPGGNHIIATIAPESARQAEEEALAGGAGLRPVEVWVPDTNAPGFVEMVRQQCLAIAAAENTLEGREEAAFWDGITADAWDGLE